MPLLTRCLGHLVLKNLSSQKKRPKQILEGKALSSSGGHERELADLRTQTKHQSLRVSGSLTLGTMKEPRTVGIFAVVFECT